MYPVLAAEFYSLNVPIEDGYDARQIAKITDPMNGRLTASHDSRRVSFSDDF